MDKGIKKTTFGAVILLYLIIALEIIIMVSPFAGYFYSVYGPFLNLLSASPLTSWMTDFFLPHMTFPDDPFLMLIGYIGPLFFYLGLFIFLIAAIPLYYSKFRRKVVVKGGLYSLVRHPQYTGFAIAGLGILLYWPRFFILLMYITMLYLYYLLARNEEGRMELQFGDLYTRYKSSVPMFLPGSPGRWFKRLIPVDRLGLLPVYVLTLILGIGIAFVLRAYTASQIPSAKVEEITAVSIFPMREEKIKEFVKIALEDAPGSHMMDEVEMILGKRPPAVYMMPADYAMMGLISEVKKRFPMEMDMGKGHKHRHGKIGRYFTLLLHHLYMVGGKGVSEPPVMRVFFVDVSYRGERFNNPLSIGVRRIPVFYVDIDIKEKRIINHSPTPPTHRWGDMPMPAF